MERMDMLDLLHKETMSRETVCPLMEEKDDEGNYRFKENIRFCDCPKLREILLAAENSKTCNDGKACFVRTILLEHA